jgi:putative spermidine/putrescine transport system substrate-binding protein
MRNLRIPTALAVIALVTAACGGSGGSAAPSGMLTSLPDAEGALNLVIWAGYAERGDNDPTYDWVTPFEQDTGCTVNTTDMTDSANGVSLMQTGNYDGISASGDATLRLILGDRVQPVNFDLIPNYADVFAGLKDKPWNTVDGVGYGTPHGRGANLLMYNTDTFTAAPTSWDAVWDADSPAAGKVSVYNSYIYIADAALHLKQTNPELGINDIYQLNQEQFDAAVALLQQQKSIVGEYWGLAQDQINSFESGAMLAGTTWQYQYNVITADDANAPVAVTLPDEGSTGWSDTWMIAKNAAHPGCMYRWMDWMLSADANALATVWFGEAPVTQAACDKAEELSPGHCDTFHATDETYFSKVYFWSTPREDCYDDDSATTCKNIDDWIQAWTTITGG